MYNFCYNFFNNEEKQTFKTMKKKIAGLAVAWDHRRRCLDKQPPFLMKICLT